MSNISKYSLEQKQEAVTTFLLVGNLRMVASMLGIKYDTLVLWKKQEWWKEAEQAIRLQENIELDRKLSNVVSKAIDIVEDRLENGEEVLNNKTGALVKKPVALKDAAKVATDMLTRQHILRKGETSEQEIKETVKESLNALALEFAKWARKERRGDFTDIEPKEQNAVHEEWEEGLQEGSGPVYLETSSQEEES